jgi:hypothetical protein
VGDRGVVESSAKHFSLSLASGAIEERGEGNDREKKNEGGRGLDRIEGGTREGEESGRESLAYKIEFD